MTEDNHVLAADIERQLGLRIDVQPDGPLLLVYRRLLTGLALIRERDALGHALISEDESPEDVERILDERWDHSVFKVMVEDHAYWRTAILRSLIEAQKKSAVLRWQFEWIGKIDPVLHNAMATVRKHYTIPGSEILNHHLKLEMESCHACVFDGNVADYINKLNHI